MGTLNYLLLFVCLVMIFINNYLPTSIFGTPFVLIFSSIIIHFLTDYSFPLKSLFSFILFSINDFGIKLFAVGAHDSEGLGLVTFFEGIGVIGILIIILINAFLTQSTTLKTKIFSNLIVPIGVTGQIYFFGYLGMN